MRFISLSTVLVRKEFVEKRNNLLNHHGAGPLEARGPMQPHRLHSLKAGPGRMNIGCRIWEFHSRLGSSQCWVAYPAS